MLVPYGEASPEYERWLNGTYEAWWASSHNLPGLLAYTIIAWFGIYLILIQNLVGFRIIILVACLPAVATFHVDWQNRDGHYGWRPLARAYRTVIVSLAVHFGGLALIVFVLGLTGVEWVVGLVVLWLIAAGAYVVVPFSVFRSVFGERADERASKYFEVSPPLPDDPLARLTREDADREWSNALHACHFHPLYVRARTPGWLALSLIVPSLLALVQTAIPFVSTGR